MFLYLPTLWTHDARSRLRDRTQQSRSLDHATPRSDSPGGVPTRAMAVLCDIRSLYWISMGVLSWTSGTVFENDTLGSLLTHRIR